MYSDLLNWQNWRNIEIPSSIFVILVAARWMFAYALAFNTCSETTNMDDGISMFLTVVSEVKSEFMLEGFGEEDRRCRSSGKWNFIGLTLISIPQKVTTGWSLPQIFLKINPEFAWAANKQLPKRADSLYLWPRSKGWMQAVKRTFNLQRLKSQI